MGLWGISDCRLIFDLFGFLPFFVYFLLLYMYTRRTEIMLPKQSRNDSSHTDKYSFLI